MNPRTDTRSRSYWLKTLHQWHWISSAVCLLGMLLFAVTGLTLNNAGRIEAHPTVATLSEKLPPDLLAALSAAGTSGDAGRKKTASLPSQVADFLQARLPVDLGRKDAEWSADEVYVALPRPGGDAWLRIDRGNGEVEYERTDRGWVSYLNDLHKGRNTGLAWSWFLDVFSIACLVFSITGLLILKMHAGNRALTWPLVGLGLLVPLLLAMLFIH